MFITVLLRDVITVATVTAKAWLTDQTLKNCYLYQAQGAYNYGMLGIVFYVTSMPHYLQLKLLSGKNARTWDSMDFT